MSITISKVVDKSGLNAFIDFPHELYQGDKNYVPQLRIDAKEVLTKKKNPFFEHSDADLFLARREGKVVGRIAAICDNNYNAFHECKVGFFGFYDVINDQEVSDKLLDTAIEYAKEKGFNRILGPTNFTTNETAGMLVEGFDRPPTLMMTYNHAYYQELIENYGFRKEMDMYAYFIASKTANDKSLRLASMLEERLKRKGITIRNVNTKKLNQEINSIREIYRSAWEKNWGFVPPSDAEFDKLAQGLKLLIDKRFVFLAEKDGEMIGFGAAFPDINEITINFKKGKLLPFNLFKLLLNKKKTKKIRIVLLGVKEEYRKLGIEGVFFAKYIQVARDIGLEGGEASWILESNEMMVKGAENLNGKRTQTYRIYAKDVPSVS